MSANPIRRRWSELLRILIILNNKNVVLVEVKHNVWRIKDESTRSMSSILRLTPDEQRWLGSFIRWIEKKQRGEL